MNRNCGMVLKSLVLGVLGLLGSGIATIAVLDAPRADPIKEPDAKVPPVTAAAAEPASDAPAAEATSGPQAVPPLDIFSAPSEIPAGEGWVFVGSVNEIPDDLSASEATEGVSVQETRRLSARAVAVRVQVAVGTAGELLRVQSATLNLDALLPTFAGAATPPVVTPANFSAEDLVAGQLRVRARRFMYAYLDEGEVPIASLRIHNRKSGRWSRHELAAARERDRNLPPPEAGSAFTPVDVHKTLPDTDGDGIYDFDEAPEVVPARPRQLGVRLEEGTNVLDIIAVDEAGNASWQVLEVVAPEEV